MESWYKDNLLVGVLLFIIFFMLGFSFYLGKQVAKKEIINQCGTFSSFVIEENKRMVCVIKPDVPLMEGGQEYMRPSGSKVIKAKVM